ncbi:polysaccharide pyruvyl transferase family protein [Oscillatoria sp. FACHB-1406]|uniref:polysaccharide pyruvyl transferase family protein n=1 Tax=Oscillatoria sp. FACHB-1406 TaxID=2692846 RepID=UPI0016847C1F|nr:polysaccharide pyruvyl transferase family protein [Oscillatoria sp. FACHB-1406]MBD2579632.1 polysaccharide pyruvyl transferase family protein [Oscillatoria sp. FACHB-1406]
MTSPNTSLSLHSGSMELKRSLSESLKKLDYLSEFKSCALLDYPNYLNLGDRAIWVGAFLALTEVLNLNISYIASEGDFSDRALAERAERLPIFLNGGGNFGDLWPKIQTFRERIISQYRDRPIIILPQSIYYVDRENLKKTAALFNAHPNLTLFLRDRISYDLAVENFPNCRLFLAPDMAFQMVGLPGLPQRDRAHSSTLYLCRDDRELDKRFAPSAINQPNLVVEDWHSYSWLLGTQKSQFIQAIASLVREGWQRGLATPDAWLARQNWDSFHPQLEKFKHSYGELMQRQSWSFLYSAFYQLSQHRFVITNRLHAHILCVILEIPHIFLPNSYHKNEAFYESWTSRIPFCKFVKEPACIETAIQALQAWI